jgi:trehalose/maltose hydrolase-like predicted phosphorylase
MARGFAGMRTVDGLSLKPFLPEAWQGYGFQFNYRGRVLRLEVDREKAAVNLLSGDELELTLCGEKLLLKDQIIHRF